jgi:hypothetical protein
MKNLILFLVLTSTISTFATASNSHKLSIATTPIALISDHIIFNVMELKIENRKDSQLPLSDEEIKRTDCPIAKDAYQTHPTSCNPSKIGV